MARWARAASEAEVDAAIEALASGDVFARSAAAFLAGLTRRAEHLLKALRDESTWVRRTAANFAGSRCDGASLCRVVRELAPATRLQLATVVGRSRRPEVARALAMTLLEGGDRRAARPLLEFAAEAELRAVYAAAGPRALRWKPLARRHPALVLELLAVELSAASRDTTVARVWSTFAAAVEPLVRSHPSEVLSLWERHGPRASWPQALGSSWPALLAAEPDRLTALLTRVVALSGQALPAAIRARARRLPAPALARLARAVVGEHAELARLLEALPPSRRAACFAEATSAHDTTAVEWSDEVLVALPHEVRHAEARRMRGLAVVLRDPLASLHLTAFLPSDEAMPWLAPALKAAKGEDRARAWGLRLKLVASNRWGLRDALTELARLKNEQDPVRLAALQALSQVPVGLFADADAPILGQLAEDSTQARDTSEATRSSLLVLAHRLLCARAEEPQSPLFRTALTMLARLAAQRPRLDFHGLGAGLRRGAEAPLVAALVPWLEGEVRREYHANVIALGQGLGRRGRSLPALQALLEAILFNRSASVNTWERQAALSLWLESPEGRDERVRRLLDWDASSVTLAPVWQHLHRYRQDWLDPFLAGRRLSGRFGSEKTGWVFPATTGFHRWLRRQQDTFARTLRAVLDDGGQHLETRARCLGTLAALQVTELRELEPLARHQEVRLAEAALEALPWLDTTGPGVASLLASNLDSDRARVAMYAMPRVARLLPEPQLLEVLTRLLARETLKVTVRKEVVRLLGELRLPGVSQQLEAEWRRAPGHRDVRLALLHAARRRLDEPEAWAMLEAAAGTGERELASSLLGPPVGEVPPAHRGRYAALLMGLAGHPTAEVRHALFTQLAAPGGWATVVPGAAAERAAAVLLSLSTEAPWPQAAAVLALIGAHPDASGALGACAAVLVQRTQVEATASRAGVEDLPSQARLERLCQTLIDVDGADRERTEAARAVLGRALEPVLAWLGPQWLELKLVDLPLTGDDLEATCRVARPHVDGPTRRDALARWGQDPARAGTAVDLLELASGLAPYEPWGALGLLVAATSRFGWSPAARAQLGELRAHPEVGAAARRVRAP